MIERSYDPEIIKKAVEPYPEFKLKNFDFEGWTANENNMLFTEGDNTGFLTYEYPGVYNAHWFFTVRGVDAVDLAKRMLDHAFTNYDVKTIRGLTPANNMRARVAAQRVGLTSHGIIDTVDGPHELLLMTKEEFYNNVKEGIN